MKATTVVDQRLHAAMLAVLLGDSMARALMKESSNGTEESQA